MSPQEGDVANWAFTKVLKGVQAYFQNSNGPLSYTGSRVGATKGVTMFAAAGAGGWVSSLLWGNARYICRRLGTL